MIDSPDVLIVGGGPAGAALALHLSKAAPSLASRTLIVEKRRHPRHKVCAGGLIPHTLACLRELGIALRVPHALVHHATARIPRGEVRYSDHDLCAVVRRDEFDSLLVDHVRQSGVEVREDDKVLEVRRDGGGIRVFTSEGELRPRVVVGADGSGSIVRRQVFGAARETIGRAVMCDLPARAVGAVDAERYVFDFAAVPLGLKGYAWEFPCWIGGELHANVGAYALDRGASVSLPHLVSARAREMGVSSPRLESFPIRWYDGKSAIGGPGALLVGDAAGCDPLMGEGISYAFEYGRLAAGAIRHAFSNGDFDFASYTEAVSTSWFGRKLRRLGTVARLFYGRASRLGFALAARSLRLQHVGIRWYNGVDDWDRINGWRAIGRLISGAT